MTKKFTQSMRGIGISITLIIAFLTIGIPNAIAQTCSNGSNVFTWDGTGSGNEAVMDQLTTFTTSFLTGCSEDIAVSIELDNPDNVFYSNNIDLPDLSGTNGTFGQPGYAMWLDANNDLFDQTPMGLDDEASLIFSFSNPIILQGVTIKDIDWRNLGISARWRDKITLTATTVNGVDVPLTAVSENPGSSTINISGQTALADYNATSGDGGLDVVDTEGHVTWSSTEAFSTLRITYISGVGNAGQQIIHIGNIDFCCPTNRCTDGATVGTPSANDADGDGINGICDLDEDNDGILDTVECPPVGVDSGVDGPLSSSDISFDISGNTSDAYVPQILNSITYDGTTYSDFIYPDSYIANYDSPSNPNIAIISL